MFGRLLPLLGVLTLVRYRAMVPFMFALLLLEHLARRLIVWLVPMSTSGTPPGSFINLALAALMIVGLLLSLRNRDQSRAPR